MSGHLKIHTSGEGGGGWGGTPSYNSRMCHKGNSFEFGGSINNGVKKTRKTLSFIPQRHYHSLTKYMYVQNAYFDQQCLLICVLHEPFVVTNACCCCV